MHASLRERRQESGFTLIELLVVMIIIAILMAVAVPTFLAQKNTAQKTKATANIKQIVTAIDSCAANDPNGAYPPMCTTFTGAANVAPANTLKAFEKGLAGLPGAVNANVGTFQVTPSAVAPNVAQGYMVQTAIKDGPLTIYFAEMHFEDGSLYKRCGRTRMAPPLAANPAPAKTTLGGPVAGSRTCTTGDWG